MVNFFKGWEDVFISVLDILKVVFNCNYIYFKVEYYGIVLFIVINEIINEVIYLEVLVLVENFFLYNLYNKIIGFESVFLVV